MFEACCHSVSNVSNLIIPQVSFFGDCFLCLSLNSEEIMPVGGVKRPAANTPPAVQGSPTAPAGSAQKTGRYTKLEVVGTYVPFETDNPVEQSIEEDKINLMKLVSEPQHEGFIHKYYALIKSGYALRLKAPKNCTRIGEWRPEKWTTFSSIVVGWQEAHLIGIDPDYTEVCGKMKANKKGSTADLWIRIHCVQKDAAPRFLPG